MLEGLEISEIRNNSLERTLRLDAEFYSKFNLGQQKLFNDIGAQSLSNFATISDGNHMSISDNFVDDGVPYYRGGDIYNVFIETTPSPLRIPKPIFDMPTMQRSHLQKGDVLMSIVGAIIGNVSLVTTNNPATCSCKLAIIRPNKNEILPEYLGMYLMSKYGQQQIQKFRRGSGQTGLILEDFDQLLIPNIDLSIQKDISEIVNRSYESLIKGRQLYVSAENFLLECIGMKDFKQSSEAVSVKRFSDFASSGRLDAEYYHIKYDNLEEKIKSVSYKTVADLQTFNARGVQPDYIPDGNISVVNSKHILENGLDYDNFEKTSSEFLKQNERAVIRKNDILVYTTGANVGRTQPYLLSDIAIASNHVNILRLDGVNPIYAALVLNSKVGRLQTEKACTGSAQAELYPSDLEKFLIPILPKDKQELIAEKVKQSFAFRTESKELLEIAKHKVEDVIYEISKKQL